MRIPYLALGALLWPWGLSRLQTKYWWGANEDRDWHRAWLEAMLPKARTKTQKVAIAKIVTAGTKIPEILSVKSWMLRLDWAILPKATCDKRVSPPLLSWREWSHCCWWWNQWRHHQLTFPLQAGFHLITIDLINGRAFLPQWSHRPRSFSQDEPEPKSPMWISSAATST